MLEERNQVPNVFVVEIIAQPHIVIIFDVPERGPDTTSNPVFEENLIRPELPLPV